VCHEGQLGTALLPACPILTNYYPTSVAFRRVLHTAPCIQHVTSLSCRGFQSFSLIRGNSQVCYSFNRMHSFRCLFQPLCNSRHAQKKMLHKALKTSPKNGCVAPHQVRCKRIRCIYLIIKNVSGRRVFHSDRGDWCLDSPSNPNLVQHCYANERRLLYKVSPNRPNPTRTPSRPSSRRLSATTTHLDPPSAGNGPGSTAPSRCRSAFGRVHRPAGRRVLLALLSTLYPEIAPCIGFCFIFSHELCSNRGNRGTTPCDSATPTTSLI
jgi:hypothetical protein